MYLFRIYLNLFMDAAAPERTRVLPAASVMADDPLRVADRVGK
jgi:hypothetical protein